MRFGLTENDRSEPVDPHALQTLKDDETIARLAIGIKRFTLPDEFNPIKIYQTIADDPETGHGEDALAQLASIFENRRQFDRAAGYLKRSKDVYGDPGGAKNQQMQQILGAWGQFEPLMTQPAGRGATVDFRFRNGRRVHFEAHEVRLAKLLSDVKEYIASSPPQLDWQQIDVNDVGSRLVALNQQQYLGRLVARWDLELEPPVGAPRQADHREHALAEGRGLSADRPDGRRECQPHRGLPRRHGDRQEIHGGEGLLLRRRFPHRPTRTQGGR